MKFSTREDIEAPIEKVFAHLSDFETHERAVLHRGAQVTRIDCLAAPGAGMCWLTRFEFRGKPREVETELTEYTPDEAMELKAESSGLVGITRIDLVALSPRKTRLAVSLDVKPQTISARLVLQGLRLAKSNLSDRFKTGIARYGRYIEGA
ncbi:uncharacterized protein Ga0609869_001091 [Rhodovulum iodosum]|uniref:SRPBCC family protein n=1 Tax=Rhodovulum iodosum TaxID=68291 RepID=A0ABV3XTR4_9RHOB|nr:SRPBCC family protein [Rhodovulum robiginosum]RSK32841.1 SRPBCC family protein [Rhodovulum robiginosum]